MVPSRPHHTSCQRSAGGNATSGLHRSRWAAHRRGGESSSSGIGSLRFQIDSCGDRFWTLSAPGGLDCTVAAEVARLAALGVARWGEWVGKSAAASSSKPCPCRQLATTARLLPGATWNRSSPPHRGQGPEYSFPTFLSSIPRAAQASTHSSTVRLRVGQRFSATSVRFAVVNPLLHVVRPPSSSPLAELYRTWKRAGLHRPIDGGLRETSSRDNFRQSNDPSFHERFPPSYGMGRAPMMVTVPKDGRDYYKPARLFRGQMDLYEGLISDHTERCQVTAMHILVSSRCHSNIVAMSL